jgi:Tol biopolymer transport system component
MSRNNDGRRLDRAGRRTQSVARTGGTSGASGRTGARPPWGLMAAMATAALLVASTAAAQNFGPWQPAVSIDPGGLRGVNTAALEGCPAESPDGGTLFFASTRAGGQGGIDIWVAHRNGEDELWGDPQALPEPVNSAFNDFCPTPLPGGRLLFVSNRGSACGTGADIYQTRLHPVRGWLEPEHLGCTVNSFGNEFSPSLVEANGRTMLFFSSDRSGIHNLYLSLLGRGGRWGEPKPVPELNSVFNDFRPTVRKDGLEIVFDSTRDGGPPQIWSSHRDSIDEPWSAPVKLGPDVNIASSPQTRPSFSWDGTRLYFGSAREGGEGDFDLYVSTRNGPGHGR